MSCNVTIYWIDRRIRVGHGKQILNWVWVGHTKFIVIVDCLSYSHKKIRINNYEVLLLKSYPGNFLDMFSWLFKIDQGLVLKYCK